MDKIELAVSRYTDFSRFEQLCLEIMNYYGYPRIKKIGGYKDDGVDALSSEFYFDETRKERVFQFTMQKNTEKKISDTVNKLNSHDIEYDELILVTSQLVNNINGLTKKFRFNYSKDLHIYDLSTFVLVISKHQEILTRYFPNLNAQIQNDFYNENYFSDGAEDRLTMSMIKSTLLFSLSPELNTQQRKNLFDKAVLSIISMTENCMSISEINTEFHKRFGRILVDSQIKASIDRLISKGLLKASGNQYEPSKKAKFKMIAGITHIEQKTNALISDIINITHQVAYGIRCSIDDDRQIEFNIKKTLNLFFKYYGNDLVLDVNSIVPEMYKQEELIRLLSDSLQPDLAECLIYSLGQVLSNPTEEQAQTLSMWAKAFIGSQLMKLDPMLSDFQKNTFKDKLFILDTDFVLNCMVKHGRFSEIYTYLLNQLTTIGCKVCIPESVIKEVITHAAYSKRNYVFFKNTFEAIDEEIVYEKVKNVFVIDYYITQMRELKGFTERSFSIYIENYYEEEDPYNYMIEVMESMLPKGVQLGNNFIDMETCVDPYEKECLTSTIFNETIKTDKASYRTEEENRLIAETDASLYLMTRNLNLEQPKNKNSLLYGKAYLITNSTRSIRSAKANGIFSSVVVKPSVIIALISEIGLFDISNKSIINLMGNPFLAEVVDQNWDSIKSLIDSGVDLRGKKLPRLKRDLKQVLHSLLTDDNQTSMFKYSNEDKEMIVPMIDDVESYIRYAKSLHSKGYKLMPTAEKLIATYEKVKEEKDSQQEINESLKLELEKIGKGKQRYLRRIGKI